MGWGWGWRECCYARQVKCSTLREGQYLHVLLKFLGFDLDLNYCISQETCDPSANSLNPFQIFLFVCFFVVVLGPSLPYPLFTILPDSSFIDSDTLKVHESDVMP